MRQIAALPLFINAAGGVDICLITSRGGRRWIIPKGNPIPGLAPHLAAAQEAMEEAGLVGEAAPDSIGSFAFDRIRGKQAESCEVDVYALKVDRQLAKWAEMGQRKVLRCDAAQAQALVRPPELGALIRRYFTDRSYVPWLFAALVWPGGRTHWD